MASTEVVVTRKGQTTIPAHLRKKFKILEALYKEAVALGVFPLKDSLEGLEVDIRIAKVINSVSKDT